MHFANDNISKYKVGLDHILRIAGKPDALVTDFADIGDLMDMNERIELNGFIGRFVMYKEYVWQVAREIEEKVL